MSSCNIRVYLSTSMRRSDNIVLSGEVLRLGEPVAAFSDPSILFLLLLVILEDVCGLLVEW